jgi:CheY-like chemotaxis protein
MTLPKKLYCILVVDDDPTFCMIMREILHTDGYDVRLAYTVSEALSMLRETKPDLILSDVMMPDVDGLTLIRNLRTDPFLSEIPAIVVSAKAMPEERKAAQSAGANAFIPKPFQLQDLREAISAFLPCPVG